MPGSILLHVNGLSRAKNAARLVGRLASDERRRVVLAATGRDAPNAIERATRELGLARERVESVAYSGSPRHGLPLVAREHKCDLVVVPPLGPLDALSGRRMGYALAKRMPTDTLLLRGDAWPIRRVLACTQGESHGIQTFERAAALAKSFDAALTALHVLSQMPLEAATAEPITAKAFLASENPVALHLRELKSRIQRHALQGGVQVQTGLVEDEILAAARGHDLLVIGAHDTRRDGAFLEDIAGDLVRASPCSILVVHLGKASFSSE